ncbi:hypothetical protein BH11BAC7_BH11BAC7_00500 [soil metagenome]
MLQSNKSPDHKFLWILGVISLVGFFVRLHGSGSESITADEADTLFRIRSSESLSKLLNVWVRGDGHPPFTHLLEYFWTKIFGLSEGAVRFPFVLMGAGAIWFAGRIARLWFGTGAAIAVAAGVAFLQFPIMYSQLARPYSPGFFFSMMLVWYWSKWFFVDNTKKRYLVWFVVAGIGAAYSHYFSLLLAGLTGIAGVFFLRKETWKPYFIAGGAIIVLFLPYISIFLFQLGVGGVGGSGGWLGKPTPEFFGDHLWFVFDSSRPIIILAFGLSAITIIISRSRPNKFHALALYFWITPLLIGYLYSQKSPVLQNSTLLFSFPFLLMLLFAWIPPIEKWKNAFLIPAAFAIVLLGYLTIYKPFHLTDHFGRLKELVTSATKWQERFGAANVDIFYNVDIPYMIEYNYERIDKLPKNVLGTVNNGGKELLEFRSMVENSNANYFVYGWSTKYSPLETLAIIQEKFPYLVEKKCWFNSAVYCYSKLKEEGQKDEKEEINFQSENSFSPAESYSVTIDSAKTPTAIWSDGCGIFLIDTAFVKSNIANGSLVNYWVPQVSIPDYVELLDSTCIYSPLLKMNVGDILKNPDNEILFTARIKLIDSAAVCILVIEFQRDGKQLYWNGMESSNQVEAGETGFQNIYFGLRLPKDLRKSDMVNFVCYTNGKRVLIDYLDVKTLYGHNGIYGPRVNFK